MLQMEPSLVRRPQRSMELITQPSETVAKALCPRKPPL
jgi:hypothetical protein